MMIMFAPVEKMTVIPVRKYEPYPDLSRCLLRRYNHLMKRTRKILPPEQTAAELAHFVWCALIALRTAQQDGQALVPLTIHTFLLRWLAGAQKQRRFPRSVAAELDRLLSLGRQKGPAAGLEQRLEYLLNSCGNPVMQQSDMFRLTNAIEHLKSQGWVNAVVTDEEWQPQMLIAEYAGTDVLLTRKSELECMFEVSGSLMGGIEFMVVGDSRVVMDVLNAREFDCVLHEQHDGGCLLLLLPPEGTPADVQTVL